MPRCDGAAGVAVLGGTVVGGIVERRQDPPGADSGSTWRARGAGVLVVGAGSTVAAAVSLAGGLFALAVPCPIIQPVRARHAPALAAAVTRRARRAGCGRARRGGPPLGPRSRDAELTSGNGASRSWEPAQRTLWISTDARPALITAGQEDAAACACAAR